MPVFQDGQRPPQQQGFQQQQNMQQQFVPPPLFSTTRVSGITPEVPIREEFSRRKLTSYEVLTLRRAELINNQDFQDKKKDQDSKKGSKRSTGPKLSWQRVIISVEVCDQDVILKKIKALNKKQSIADKKAGLRPHMSIQVNNVLDEKIRFEQDPAFAWTLCQLDRVIVENKTTKKSETDTLIIYLKRAPRPGVQGLPKPPPRQAGRVGPPRKSVHYHTDDSRSGHSSETSSSDDSDSDGSSAYSNSETDSSSISLDTLNRRRRDSGYARSRRKGLKQHGKDYVVVDRPRVAAVDRTSMSPQKTIVYPNDRSQHSSIRSLDDEMRALDAELLRLENLRLQDDIRRREDLRFREDLRLREEARRFPEYPTREELRLRGNLRHAEDTIRQDELPSLRMRDPEYLRRGSLSPARDFEYTYIPFRDPFAPRRRQEELRRREDLKLREELRLREEANARIREDVRRYPEVPTGEELRHRTEPRRVEDTIHLDQLPSVRTLNARQKMAQGNQRDKAREANQKKMAGQVR
jgi:hypothetical protein